MERSESIQKLTEAMVKAQAAMRTALKKSDNPYFRSKYADLAEIWEVARGPLNQNGLCLLQPVSSQDAGSVTVTTVLAHVSGEFISEQFTVYPRPEKPKDKNGTPLQGAPEFVSPQGMGSAVSYARRYALQGLLAIATDDDDGEHAEGRRNQPQPKPSAPPPVQPCGQSADATARTAPAPPMPEPSLKQTTLDAIVTELKRRFPNQDNGDKKKKADALELLFGTRKWSEVAALSQAQLADGLAQLTAPAPSYSISQEQLQ